MSRSDDTISAQDVRTSGGGGDGAMMGVVDQQQQGSVVIASSTQTDYQGYYGVELCQNIAGGNLRPDHGGGTLQGRGSRGRGSRGTRWLSLFIFFLISLQISTFRCRTHLSWRPIQ